MQLYNGDCLEIMKDISNNSIDIVIADLPYGRFSEVSVGATKWDTAIDLKNALQKVADEKQIREKFHVVRILEDENKEMELVK